MEVIISKSPTSFFDIDRIYYNEDVKVNRSNIPDAVSFALRLIIPLTYDFISFEA